jgi:hypothetical protein
MVGMYKLLKAPQKSKLLILLWAIIPIVLFLVLDPKSERYILPVFPAFCLIASSGIMQLKNKILKRSLVSLCLIIYISVFFIISFGSIRYDNNIFRLIGLYVEIHNPAHHNLDNVGKKFAAAIQKYNNKDKSYKVGILEQAPLFFRDDPVILLYYIRLKMPDKFSSMKKNALISTAFSNNDFIQILPSLDFLIIPTKVGEDVIDYKNILNSDFQSSEVLNENERYMVKKYLSDFEVISKEKAYSEFNCILNLLAHK